MKSLINAYVIRKCNVKGNESLLFNSIDLSLEALCQFSSQYCFLWYNLQGETNSLADEIKMVCYYMKCEFSIDTVVGCQKHLVQFV